MNTLAIEIQEVRTLNVLVTDDELTVDLSDGRTISVPLSWYPRLVYATASERNNWQLIGNGEGIHWLDLDEDISTEGLVFGRASSEGQTSFNKWLQWIEEKRKRSRN